MKLNKKKGFTIIELVIVIAVIGVLAAVLIPVFINLTAKANEASDESLVKNLNTALKMEEQEPEDTKNVTLQDAIDDLIREGFILENLVAKSGKDLLWDQTKNEFLMNKEGVEGNQYWQIVNALPAKGQAKYSYYAGSRFSTASTANELKYGFDAGYNQNIENLTFTGTNEVNPAYTVAIRTNTGALTINAKNHNVVHYGNADSINVVDVKGQSYHENGSVKFLEVAAGHIVLESDSNVSAIHFTATDDKFENQDGKKISLDLSKNAQEEAPIFTRDAVTIEDNGTFVATVTTSSTEYLWLFGAGIKEQMVVTETEGAIATNGTLKEGIEAGAETGSIADQIANPAKRNDQGQLIDEDDQVIDVTEVDFNKKDALDTVPVVIDEVPSKEDVQTGAVLFGGGSGKESDPFIITDYDTFQNISKLYDEDYYFYKVKDGVESIDCSYWIPVNLNGSFDGNGVKLNNIDERLFLNIGAMGAKGDVESWSTEDVTVGNFDCYFNLVGNLDTAQGMAKQVLGNNTTVLHDINIYGQIVGGSNSGAMFSYTTGNPYDSDQHVEQTILINDCKVYATLVGTSTSDALITGYPDYCNPNLRLYINNPDEIWQGVVTTVDGTIRFTSMANWTGPEGNTPNQTINCSKLKAETLVKNVDGSYSIPQTTNATTVRSYISAQLSETNEQGQPTPVAGITMSIQFVGEYELAGSTEVLEGFNQFNFVNKAKDSSARIENNTLFVEIGGTNNYTFGTIKLVVIEFDSNGNVLSYGTKNIVTKANGGSWIIQ